MKKEITNCGLIALSNVIDIKSISIKTLILAAKDNGLKLFPYKIDLNEIEKVKLPAIFHANNHFIFISKKEELSDFEFTGNILHTEKQPYEKIPNNQLKMIKGCSWVAVGVTGAGIVSGLFKSKKAKKEKQAVARELANRKEMPLQNIAEGLQVSTRSSDLQKEESARTSASSIDALAEGGSRTMGVGVGRVAASNMAVNAGIGADLDSQQKNIDTIRAQDAGTIRMTKEQREQAKLAALSSQYNAANQNQAEAGANAFQAAGTAASILGGSDYYSKDNVAARKAKRK